MAENKQEKKPTNVIFQIVCWLVMVVALTTSLLTVFSVVSSKNNGVTLFGYRVYVAQGDSMAKTHFKAGDVVISRQVDINTLQQGDVITFVSKSVYNYGQTVTHCIRKVTYDTNGQLAFETYGTTTGKSDSALATQVLGKYVGKIPKIGKVVIFLKTPTGFFSCILIPFAVLLILQLINCFSLLKKTK